MAGREKIRMTAEELAASRRYVGPVVRLAIACRIPPVAMARISVGFAVIAAIWLSLGSARADGVALVLNRFRKIAGFSEADAEAAAGVKVLWKIPNQYFAVSTAIDRGIPLMHQHHTEIARSFIGLAHLLTENDVDVKRKAWSLFKTV